MWKDSKTQNVKRLKNSKCDKTYNVTELKNIKCDKTKKKLNMWQNKTKTQSFTTQKSKCEKKNKSWQNLSLPWIVTKLRN